MAFKMRTGTASEFGNGSNMSEGEIVNVKSGLTTENGGAMFYAPRDGVPERVVTDVDQTIQSDINFTGTLSKNGTPLTPTAAEINRLSGVTDNIQSQINDANDAITALNQSLANLIKRKSFTVTPSAAGNASHAFGRNVFVLAAGASVADTVVIPYPSSAGYSTWWFNCHAAGVSFPPYTSGSLAITVAYIEIG